MERTYLPFVKVYSGKPGCMCGCKGKYISFDKDPKAAKQMYSRIMKLVENDDLYKEEVERTDSYLFVSNGSRYYCIYFS